jgi:hypothetical protein
MQREERKKESWERECGLTHPRAQMVDVTEWVAATTAAASQQLMWWYLFAGVSERVRVVVCVAFLCFAWSNGWPYISGLAPTFFPWGPPSHPHPYPTTILCFACFLSSPTRLGIPASFTMALPSPIRVVFFFPFFFFSFSPFCDIQNLG